MLKPSSTSSAPYRRESTDSLLDLGVVARAFWRGRVLLTAFIIAAIALGLWRAYSLDPFYSAPAYLIIEPENEGIVDLPAGLTGASAPRTGEVAGAISDELRILTSRPVLRAAADRLSLAENPQFNPFLVQPEEPNPWPSILDRVMEAVPFLTQKAEPVAGPASEEPRPEPPSILDRVREALPFLAQNSEAASEPDAVSVSDALMTRAVLARLGAALQVDQQGLSSIVAITATAEDPELAAAVSNAVAEA
ncbi:hypothetical protein LCGC14_1837440, partial [marine sediment metagenome]